ncbi:MAG: hypothetical protein OWU32_00055 [Firmicutes bacterium]|nr:hypothetical protein [Bacillota bacterium]
MSKAVILEFVDRETAVALTSDMTFVRVARDPGMVIGGQVELPHLTLVNHGSSASGSMVDPNEDSAATTDSEGVGAKTGRVAGGSSLGRLQRGARKGSATEGRSFGYRIPGIRTALVGGVALLAVLTVGVFGSGQSAWAKPVAYVSLDVNPSVQFALNQGRRVVAVQGLDADGTSLLHSVHLLGLPVTNAVRIYLKAVVGAGYVKPDASVIVTTSLADEGGVSSSFVALLQRQVDHEVKADLKGRSYLMASLVVPPSLRQAADEEHISAGRLALYTEARKDGDAVSWTQLVNGHLSAAVGGRHNLDQIVSKLKADAGLVKALGTVTTEMDARGQTSVPQTSSEAQGTRSTQGTQGQAVATGPKEPGGARVRAGVGVSGSAKGGPGNHSGRGAQGQTVAPPAGPKGQPVEPHVSGQVGKGKAAGVKGSPSKGSVGVESVNGAGGVSVGALPSTPPVPNPAAIAKAAIALDLQQTSPSLKSGPQGRGLQGKGSQGQGPQGKGPQGKGPQGKGPQGKGPQGQGQQSEGSQGQGPQGNAPQGQGQGPQGQGPQGKGTQGHGPQGKAPQGQGHQGKGPQGQGQGPQARTTRARTARQDTTRHRCVDKCCGQRYWCCFRWPHEGI